jgi:choline transport protein
MAADKFDGDITIDPVQATRDDIDLMKTGHKPVMKRNYSFMSILAFAFMTVIAYVGIMASMGSGINSGGTVMLIYGTLLCTFFTVMVCLSLAELAGV